MLCYYADKSKTNQNQFTLQCQHRLMNCNEASCEWNQQGDRAVITVGSDVDSVGMRQFIEHRLVSPIMGGIQYTFCLTIIRFEVITC